METQIKDLKIAEVAEQLSVSTNAVLSWIRSGALEAYNVARSETARPLYRVTQRALDDFKERRTQRVVKPNNNRKRQVLPSVIRKHL